MSLKPVDIERALDAFGFSLKHRTKKISEYASSKNGKTIYFVSGVGLPAYFQLVVHPDDRISLGAHLHGVTGSAPSDYYHNSNMISFPKRINRGEASIHYGISVKIDSLNALEKFAAIFHLL